MHQPYTPGTHQHPPYDGQYFSETSRLPSVPSLQHSVAFLPRNHPHSILINNIPHQHPQQYRSIPTPQSTQHQDTFYAEQSNTTDHPQLQSCRPRKTVKIRQFPSPVYCKLRTHQPLRIGNKGPYRDKDGPLGGGAITTQSAADALIDRPISSTFWDIPGRTHSLLMALIIPATALSFLNITFVLYPLLTGSIDLGVFLFPYFQEPQTIQALFKAIYVIAQSPLPSQLLHFLIGPAGVLFFAAIGLTFSAREMGMVGNLERALRRENPFFFSIAVCIFALSLQAAGFAGQSTIYRYAPPAVNNILSLATRVIPHLFALTLTSRKRFCLEETLLELMMPVAVLSSTFGIALSFFFAFIIRQLQECLPSDGVFFNKQLVITRPHSYSIRFMLHPIVWTNIFIHAAFFSFPIFWMSNISNAHQEFRIPSSIASSYQAFLIAEGLGRYILPFCFDRILGHSITRFDFLTFFMPPFMLLNLLIAGNVIHPKFNLYAAHCNAAAISLFSAYMVSLTRSTIDAYFLTSVLATAHTLALLMVLLLNHGFLGLFAFPLQRALQIHSSILIVSGGCIIRLWLHYRDLLGDFWGYPQARILGRVNQISTHLNYIPTAMIPLWVHKRPEHEQIQRHYYSWNARRATPSEIKAGSVRHQQRDIKAAHKERAKLREVKERIAL